MRFERVLLLFPDYRGGHFGALRPPAGLGYLAEALSTGGVEYDVVDMAAGHSEDDLRRKLKAFRPDLVGLSLMSFMYLRSYEIAGLVKREAPWASVIAGGPHISTVREKVLEECPSIDFGAVLEGEETIVELCRGDDVRSIKGLIRRDGQRVVFNGERPFIGDLNRLRYPRYEGFPLGKYVTEEIGIVTSRGCPFGCIYCPVKAAIGKTWRSRSPEGIVDEIGYWHGMGYRQFSMLDDNFTLSRSRVIRICDEIGKRGLSAIELNCNNGIRADRVDREMLLRMKQAGFRYLAFGVEAGNDRVLKNINKGETVGDIEAAVSTALELGYRVTLFFIIGSPGETIEDVKDSISLAQKYPVFDARFYNLIPFPRSELYEWVEENGLFTQDPELYLNCSSQWDREAVFRTPEMDQSKRAEALDMARAARKKIRFASMRSCLRPKMGPLSSLAARLYVNDWVQDRLMKSSALRRNLKRAFMRLSG